MDRLATNMAVITDFSARISAHACCRTATSASPSWQVGRA